MADFTLHQQDAIKCRDKTVLVSAAAGSGKTTTLTERIIRRLTDPKENADISKFLIVTFTKAAAADLRFKISAALSAAIAENPASKHLSSQMIKLSGAKICTIDSFYLDVVKNNFDALGLPAKLSMMDPGELKILKNKVMDKVIDDLYESKTDDFAEFMDSFISSRGVSTASPELISIYEKLSGYPKFLSTLTENARRFREEAENDIFSTECGKELYFMLREFLSHALCIYDDALEIILSDDDLKKAYGPSFAYDREFYKNLSLLLEKKDYDGISQYINGYSPIRLGTLKKEAKYKAEEKDVVYAKDNRKELVKKLRETFRDKYFCYSSDIVRADLLRTASFCDILYEVLSEFDRRMSKEKLQRGMADFTDNKRFALSLFVGDDGNPTDLAREYSEKFDEIYIDEYQDTDSVQDMIFSAISKGNNRFMVGDIKQSIYRFRGANPSVFTRYKKDFPVYEGEGTEGSSAAIYMSENFRCDRSVIDVTNGICGYLFGKGPNSIGYTKADDLVFGKRVLPEREMKKVKITAYASDNSSDELEMRGVISEIIRLTETPCELTEEKGALRRINYGDIAILVRDNATADRYADALGRFGIPASSRTEVSYFENPEVLLVMSLLNIIDNPQKDVYLAGTLSSPLFGFDMDELIRIRKMGNGSASLYDDFVFAFENMEDGALKSKMEYFLSKLRTYRLRASCTSTHELIRFIYSDTSMLSFASGGDGENGRDMNMRRANLLLLYDYARRFESGSYKGLYSFINYINDIIEAEQTIEMPSAYSDGGKVNVMTIHNSKGLEFPVCFIAATRKRARSDSGVIQFDEKIGVGASFGDESGLIKYENLIRQIIIAKNAREELEEQMRVLYVAMTRARERLYISAGVKGSSYMDEAQRRAYVSDSFSVMSCSNYFDWVCTAYYAMDEKTRDMIEFSTICDEDIPEISPVSDRGEKEKSEGINEEDISALIDVFRERFDFEYPYSHLEKIPAKLSVSGLYPAVLDDGEGESLLDDEVDICSMPAFLIPKEERASGAEKGTATHTFLQFCDFDAAETSVEAEIARLEEQGFISREMSELISVSMLRRFFESRFYAFIKDSLKNGGRIYREQRFNIAMPAALFTENDSLRDRIENEMIVVQGVIDLIVVDRNGDIILCDYKTDHLSKEELSSAFLAAKKLSERYSQQLSYYSVAVERLFGKAPIKTYIYSLPFGDALPLG